MEISIERFTPGQRAIAPGQEGPRHSGSSCSLFPWIFDPGTAKGGIPPSPGHRRFIVICDDQPVGTRWVGPADPLAALAARATELAALAERALHEIPLGGVSIGHRPEARALTGVPTYVWVTGYDGRPVTRTVRDLGATVDVRITLQQVIWDFGDGTPTLAAGLGEPWPRRSPVRHTYGTSTPHGHPATITANLSFFAEYRVDGGAWQALAPITRPAATLLEVDEVQAVRRR